MSGFLVSEVSTYASDNSKLSAPAFLCQNNPVLKRRINPSLVITKYTAQGKPVRGYCPICDNEFSTEAFEDDPSYEHEQKLKEVYDLHFAQHLSEAQ